MPYTSMPAWPDLSDQEVSDLAYFITTFSPDFSNPENVPKPVELPSAPGATQESIELGKKLYEETGCLKCHGNLGRGDGPSAPTLMDDLGQPIRAADLTQPWTFRGGSSREDIFRTMTTGLNGTPMPSFADSLTPEQRWAITDFIASLSGSDEPGYTNLVVAKAVQDPIDLAKGAASFESAPVARFPIIGQIMEPGRAFHPPATSVTVQAIYDAESIALLVRWHDMSAEKTGKNGPSLPVPPEEEEVGGRRCAGATRSEPLRRGGSRASRSRPQRIPLPRRQRQPPRRPSSPTQSRSRFLRRCRRARASPTSSSATPRTRWISGSSIWPAPIPFSSPAGEARTSRRTTRGMSPASRATTRENGRSSSSGPFAPASGAPFAPGAVHADRLLGLGRVLARAWQQARSHGLVLPLRRAGSGPIGRRPDGEDGAAHSRHRAGRDRLGAAVALRLSRPRELGGEPSQPAATRA